MLELKPPVGMVSSIEVLQFQVRKSKKHLLRRRQRIDRKYFENGINNDSKLDIISENFDEDDGDLNQSESEFEIVSDEDNEESKENSLHQ